MKNKGHDETTSALECWKRTKKTDGAERLRVIDSIGLRSTEPPELKVALYLVGRKLFFSHEFGPVFMPRPIALLATVYQIAPKIQ